MEPSLSSIVDNGQLLTFTLSGVDVSIANGLRRIVLSEIPSLVFRTTPYENNKCEIRQNTTRLNNEIVKQRLSCIPIHVTDLSIPWDKFEVEVKKENTEFAPIIVTTEDFKIKDTSTDSYLSRTDTQKIFPPDPITNEYITFLRLRPKISETGSGEAIDLTCKFDVGTAKEDGSFTAASTCAYGNTLDGARIEQLWAEKEAVLKQQEMDADKIMMAKKNWLLLDGKRVFIENSFDFKIETVGVYSNLDLVKMGCTLMIDKITKFERSLSLNAVKIERSKTTIDNSFDVTLEDEDYTFGKVIESILYNKFYKTQMLTYCGFKKFHPHDSFSVIRLAFPAETEQEIVNQHLLIACGEAKLIYEEIVALF